MKTLLTIFFALLFVTTSNAGNIITYKNKKPGETMFLVINSRNIDSISYSENHKQLVVGINSAINYRFIVKNKEDAQEIIKKIFNTQDTSLIELEPSK